VASGKFIITKKVNLQYVLSHVFITRSAYSASIT